MSPVAARERIKKHAIPVLKAHGISRAGIFGSYARGTASKNSDIDILIDTNGKLGLFALSDLKLSLEKELKKKVDLVEYRAIKPALRTMVMRDHRKLL